MREALANFISETRWEDVPQEIRRRCRTRLLDVIGCALAARDYHIARAALAYARERSHPGGSRYWLGAGDGMPEDCAFVNSVLAHSLCHEDLGHGGHPGSNIVPAAIAVAEQQGRSGVELLVALIVAYEVQERIGSADVLHSIGDRGLRGTTTPAAFGSAAATARLLRLSPAATANALSFAASLCVPGIEEPLLVGTSERMMHIGANARSGVTAGYLAQLGFDGAPSALTGGAGYYAAYTGKVPSDSLTEGLGSTWLSEDVMFKPYPTAGWNTGPIYCALELARDGLRWEEVQEVHVLHVWWHRNEAYIFPGPFVTMEQAIISCNFNVACALIYGRHDWETMKLAFSDERVAGLAQRVHVDGVATYGNSAGAVSVRTSAGTMHRASVESLPDALLRPDWDGAVAKFLHMTEAFLSLDASSAIVAEVEAIEHRDSVEELANLLAQSID